MTNLDFSRILRRLVAESGKSYSDIARQAGIAHSTILQWANGKVSPRLDTADMVLEILGHKVEVVEK